MNLSHTVQKINYM